MCFFVQILRVRSRRERKNEDGQIAFIYSAKKPEKSIFWRARFVVVAGEEEKT